MYLQPYNTWKFQEIIFLLIIRRFVKSTVLGLETEQTCYIKILYANPLRDGGENVDSLQASCVNYLVRMLRFTITSRTMNNELIPSFNY